MHIYNVTYMAKQMPLKMADGWFMAYTLFPTSMMTMLGLQCFLTSSNHAPTRSKVSRLWSIIILIVTTNIQHNSVLKCLFAFSYAQKWNWLPTYHMHIRIGAITSVVYITYPAYLLIALNRNPIITCWCRRLAVPQLLHCSKVLSSTGMSLDPPRSAGERESEERRK